MRQSDFGYNETAKFTTGEDQGQDDEDSSEENTAEEEGQDEEEVVHLINRKFWIAWQVQQQHLL